MTTLMQSTEMLEAKRELIRKTSSRLSDYIEVVFDNAPVMMHSVDRDGRLVNVNGLWLEKLGYEKIDVIGMRSTDLLTEESRARAINDTLPLFWSSGYARSVGYQFVRKDGQVVDVLLDADAIRGISGEHVTLAPIREDHDLQSWRQSLIVLKILHELIELQRQVEDELASGQTNTPDSGKRVLNIEQVDVARLTARELEILRSLVSGNRNKDIASELSLSLRTVRFHIENIYQKLGVHTRIQAFRVARDQGIIDS